MPFQKIFSFPSDVYPRAPVRYSDDISQHFASFQFLMTEKSTMLSTSLTTGVQHGRAGAIGHWLLEQIA